MALITWSWCVLIACKGNLWTYLISWSVWRWKTEVTSIYKSYTGNMPFTCFKTRSGTCLCMAVSFTCKLQSNIYIFVCADLCDSFIIYLPFVLLFQTRVGNQPWSYFHRFPKFSSQMYYPCADILLQGSC